MRSLVARHLPAFLAVLLGVLVAPGLARAQIGDFGGAAFLAEPELAMAAGLDPAGFLGGSELFLGDPELVLADLSPPRTPGSMTDPDLDRQRGGFMTPLGLDIGFGAVVRTTINGALALETRLTWDPGQGPPTKTVTAGAESLDLAAASAGGIHLPANTPQEWSGVVVPAGDGGATAVLHQLGASGITNMVLNTADNRDIRQDTDVTLTVPNLDALTKDALAAGVGTRLQDALGLAVTTAAMN